MLTIRSILARQLDGGVVDSDNIIRTHVIGPLKSAYAVEVAAVIRDVYRESMNNNLRGLGQINNPFTGTTGRAELQHRRQRQSQGRGPFNRPR